jgi:hypothetical protein
LVFGIGPPSYVACSNKTCVILVDRKVLKRETEKISKVRKAKRDLGKR